MCQAQGGQGAVGLPQALQDKQKDSRPEHASQDPSSSSPHPTPKPHHLVRGLSLGPQSFHLSGAHPEGAGAPRAPPDPGHKLSSAQLGTRGKRMKPDSERPPDCPGSGAESLMAEAKLAEAITV